MTTALSHTFAHLIAAFDYTEIKRLKNRNIDNYLLTQEKKIMFETYKKKINT